MVYFVAENELDALSHIVIKDPIATDLKEENIEVGDIYYRTSLKSEVIIPLNGESLNHLPGKYSEDDIDETEGKCFSISL